MGETETKDWIGPLDLMSLPLKDRGEIMGKAAMLKETQDYYKKVIADRDEAERRITAFHEHTGYEQARTQTLREVLEWAEQDALNRSYNELSCRFLRLTSLKAKVKEMLKEA